jgi:hypothetical protein
LFNPQKGNYECAICRNRMQGGKVITDLRRGVQTNDGTMNCSNHGRFRPIPACQKCAEAIVRERDQFRQHNIDLCAALKESPRVIREALEGQEKLKKRITELEEAILTTIEMWESYFLPDESPNKELLFNKWVEHVKSLGKVLDGKQGDEAARGDNQESPAAVPTDSQSVGEGQHRVVHDDKAD